MKQKRRWQVWQHVPWITQDHPAEAKTHRTRKAAERETKLYKLGIQRGVKYYARMVT